MKKVMYNISFILMFVFITGCAMGGGDNNTTDEDIFQYEGTAIGDNSAVTTIMSQLKHGEKVDNVSLQTNTEPYGMTVTYDELDVSTIIKEYKETVIYNATFLFRLVNDAEWITFVFPNGEYKVTKEELQNWYGSKLSEFTNEEDTKEHIEKQLQDENKINQLLGG